MFKSYMTLLSSTVSFLGGPREASGPGLNLFFSYEMFCLYRRTKSFQEMNFVASFILNYEHDRCMYNCTVNYILQM